MNEQPTITEVFEAITEVFEAIQSFSSSVDERFGGLEDRMDRMETNMTQMKSNMVTKDYLDDKLADHGSRYGMLIRQTNKKIDALTDALVTIGSLPLNVAKRVSGMEPFASG